MPSLMAWTDADAARLPPSAICQWAGFKTAPAACSTGLCHTQAAADDPGTQRSALDHRARQITGLSVDCRPMPILLPLNGMALTSADDLNPADWSLKPVAQHCHVSSGVSQSTGGHRVWVKYAAAHRRSSLPSWCSHGWGRWMVTARRCTRNSFSPSEDYRRGQAVIRPVASLWSFPLLGAGLQRLPGLAFGHRCASACASDSSRRLASAAGTCPSAFSRRYRRPSSPRGVLFRSTDIHQRNSWVLQPVLSGCVVINSWVILGLAAAGGQLNDGLRLHAHAAPARSWTVLPQSSAALLATALRVNRR